MNLVEVDKPVIKKTVVVYSGRFQPFSPFSFREKKEIATKMFGIPSSKFVQIRNPYQPVEILKKFNGQTTQYIAAVGEKDATRLQGNYFKPYKGKAGYGYEEIGYVYAVPAEQNPISGTDVRKWLGATDVEKAKKGFLKAYPKFDKEVFKMITGKLNENFIKGYPSKEDVKKIHAKNDKFRTTATTDDSYVYDPISELIDRVAAEEIFNDFLAEYLGEAPNKALDQDITYTNVKGQQKKIKARDALRLPKDHPAHIQAAKIAGPDDAPASEPKPKEEPGKAATTAAKPSQPGQPVKKDQTPQGKTDKTTGEKGAEQAPPPEQKLSGVELKSSAETSPKEKADAEKAEKVKQALDNARKDLSEEDNQTIDKVNNPDSPERKGMMDNVKNGLKKFGKGIANWWGHQTEMVGGTMGAIKDIATTGKLGAVKDKDGKNRHWSEFASVGRGGGPEWEEVEVDVTDSHGHPTGKKKTEKRPKVSEYASDEEKELFNQSWERSKKQKKDCKNFAITAGLLLGSMAVGGAGVAAVKAVAAGSSAGAVGAAAGSGAAGAFTHGVAGFGLHLGKDIAKHATLEAMGMGGVSAASTGAALSTATLGILENIDGKNENNKFLLNVIRKVVEKMEKYKLSDEQLLKSIEDYKKNKPKQDAADLLKEKETPKISLVGGREFAEVKTSLGGFDPISKEIYVATEGRLTADILRTLAHEMVHRKQDELGLVRNPEKDGADGSPIENQAHAVAGILMREYGRINKQIYNEDINVDVDKGDTVLMGKFKNKKVQVKDIGQDQHGMPTINGKQATTFRKVDEMGSNDVHLANVMNLYKNATFRKRINAYLFGRANMPANPNAVARELRNMDYKEITARAMGIEDVASKFGGRGGLTDAYNYAMKDLSAAISSLSEAQRKKIFNEGKCFMNLEVIWPQSVNVIPYGQALLIFHNTTCYDENGVAVGADQGASSTLAGMIKQVNADVQSKYTIQGPPVTEIPKSEDLSSKKGKYLSKLKKLQSEFGLSDGDTVAMYHQSWWENFIDKKSPVKVDKLTKEALVRRWAFGDKSFRLNTISNPKLQEWAIQNDKVNVAKQQKDNIKPFEEIFLGVGADVLDFVGSVLTVHPDKAIRAIKNKFKSVASDVRSGGDKTKIQKLRQELKRLNSLGGIDRVVASEGIVFFYNGKTYKLTGTFAPLNQILGLFY